jgi:hypothetical protein
LGHDEPWRDHYLIDAVIALPRQLIDVPAGPLAERTAPIQQIGRELVLLERR